MILTMYREYRPPAGLAGLVECLWRHELPESAFDQTGVVLPDGRVDLVWTPARTLVAGPQTRFLPRPVQAPFDAIGVRFHPGVGPPLLGLPAHELVDSHVPLEAIDTRPAAALAQQLAAAADPGDAATILSRVLAKLAEQQADPVDPLVRGATRLLDASQASVDRIARELALSERQLQRRFRDAVGYGPKTLHRILRFRRFLAALERDADALARMAAAAGYADQAHLTRESRELAGLSPKQLAQLWRP